MCVCVCVCVCVCMRVCVCVCVSERERGREGGREGGREKEIGEVAIIYNTKLSVTSTFGLKITVFLSQLIPLTVVTEEMVNTPVWTSALGIETD